MLLVLSLDLLKANPMYGRDIPGDVRVLVDLIYIESAVVNRIRLKAFILFKGDYSHQISCTTLYF